MLLDKQSLRQHQYDSSSFVTQKQVVNLLDKANEYKDELLNVFKIDDEVKVLKIGNAKQLLNAINLLDSQCEKIDIKSKIKDLYLSKMLEAEKALFEVFLIKDAFILKKNESDLLVVETAYSAKSDLLDYYNFSKFANYCRDNEYEDLVDTIKEYLKRKNTGNEDEKKLRVLYKYEDKKFYLRALTSSDDYKNYGINFSVFVALIALGRYVDETDNEIHINSYSVDDSTIYVSFTLGGETKIDDTLSLNVSLILENDEVKRNSVSFNGLIKLNYSNEGKKSAIYLRPQGVKKETNEHPVDLLTYPHRGSVESVFKKIETLPGLIDFFINQVREDAKKIASIQHPNDIKEFIAYKIKHSRKEEFKVYRDAVFNKLMRVNVDNTFMLFNLLRDVEDLFEHDDIISLNFWRNKLYESLVNRK